MTPLDILDNLQVIALLQGRHLGVPSHDDHVGVVHVVSLDPDRQRWVVDRGVQVVVDDRSFLPLLQ